MNFVYIMVVGISISFPLAFSRSERFGFGKQIRLAWLAVFLSAIPFILWDIYFTHLQVWSFNSAYVLGFFLSNLPVEEVLFFISIPFSCLFIYQALKRYPNLALSSNPASSFWWLVSGLLVAIAFLNPEKMYTGSVCALGAITSTYLAYSRPKFSGTLISALILQYIPFFLVNGILTALPVVQYNDVETLGIRFGSIPVEDSIYTLVLLAFPVLLYEKFLSHRLKRRALL